MPPPLSVPALGSPLDKILPAESAPRQAARITLCAPAPIGQIRAAAHMPRTWAGAAR